MKAKISRFRFWPQSDPRTQPLFSSLSSVQMKQTTEGNEGSEDAGYFRRKPYLFVSVLFGRSVACHAGASAEAGEIIPSFPRKVFRSADFGVCGMGMVSETGSVQRRSRRDAGQ